MRALLLAAALLTVAATHAAAAQEAPAAVAESAVVVEARAMMDGYASAIRSGDRTAVSSLYARDGAWMARAGQTRLIPYDAIARRYADQWEAPAAFEWQDLNYIPTGPDSVTVIGRFIWTEPGKEPYAMSYHGHFVRQDGRLRILIEDEAAVPVD